MVHTEAERFSEPLAARPPFCAGLDGGAARSSGAGVGAALRVFASSGQRRPERAAVSRLARRWPAGLVSLRVRRDRRLARLGKILAGGALPQ